MGNYLPVSGSKSRSNLPGGHQQWEVPRNDLTNYTKRLSQTHAHGVLIKLSNSTFIGTDTASEVAEVINTERQIGSHGLPNGLTVVDSLHCSKVGEVLLYDIGDLQQHVAAGSYGCLLPSLEGFMGCIQSKVYVRTIRLSCFGEDLQDRAVVPNACELLESRHIA